MSAQFIDNSVRALRSIWTRLSISLLLAVMASGCATSVSQIEHWEHAGNISKLSEVARKKSEAPLIRRKSLESLARLNWKPTNEERLEVYSLFASAGGRQEAASVMRAISAEQFAVIDQLIVECCALLNESGSWNNAGKARQFYDALLARNRKGVTVSLCQQIVARPAIRTRILLLAIKLGIPGSEDDLNAVLFEYGDKPMAEDYLNSGSGKLHDGGANWANAHGYNIQTGFGSHRSGWGQF